MRPRMRLCLIKHLVHQHGEGGESGPELRGRIFIDGSAAQSGAGSPKAGGGDSGVGIIEGVYRVTLVRKGGG